MAQKTVIQYVGQFYVYGSEARAEEQKAKKNRTILPKFAPKLERVQKIYIDPAALGGIVVALFMMTVLVLGAVQLRQCWQEYDVMSSHLSEVKRENARLEHTYRTSVDLQAVEDTALKLGMVPQDQLETMTVRVTMPEHKQAPGAWENFVWFMSGLLS